MLDPDTQGTTPSDSPLSSPAARLLEAYAAGERTFVRGDLAGADLHGADLQNCKFFGADFTGADLSGADLRRADLGYAKLTRANLRGTNLSEARLEGADFTGADMTDTIKDPPSLPPAAAPDATPTIPGAPQRFCLNCHSPVNSEAAFCQACGAALTASPGASSPTTAHPSSGAASSPISMGRPATSSVSASASRATQAGAKRPAVKQGVTAGDVIELIVDLIGGAWSLIVSAAVVILVVVGGIAFIKSHFGAGLNEHSTCSQFQQADASAQDKVLQDMITAHGGQGSVTTARFSVNLYCNIYGGGAHIDGVYGSGNVGAGPERASRDAAPALVYVVYASQART